MIDKARLRNCHFVFDDSPTFTGWADGSTWNGFDNVWVLPETRDRIVAHFRALATGCHEAEEVNQTMLALPMQGGLICLGWGFATTVTRGGYLRCNGAYK